MRTRYPLLPVHGFAMKDTFFMRSFGKTDRILRIQGCILLMFSRWIEKTHITDGLVPRDSAIFGEYRSDCVDGSVSHTEIVDFMTADKKRDQIYAFWSALCEELVNAGY